jgi:hypothetical protein
MVGLLLSEVLFGRIMFMGMRAGLDCRLMGWFWNCLLLLAVAVVSYCLLMRFFCLGLARFPTIQLIWFNSLYEGGIVLIQGSYNVTCRTTPPPVRSQSCELHACTYRRINMLRESHCWAELRCSASSAGSSAWFQASTSRLSTISSNTFLVS